MTDEELADVLMRRIQRALRISVPADGGDIDVTVRMGLAFDGRDRFVLAGAPTPL